ncbi:MAG: uracil-DNA glycosylase family protein [Nitrososphaera sp.]
MIIYKFSNNMKILFVGINPHHGSFRRGVPFSNNKMFWYLLNRAGIINESIRDLKDDTRLKQIYTKKFNQEYRLGFVNLVNRATRDISQLMKGEENKGRKHVVSIIKRYEPQVVCFIGKISFEKFSQSKDFDFGWQQDIYNSKTFLMHFPIRGRAEVRVCELREISKV